LISAAFTYITFPCLNHNILYTTKLLVHLFLVDSTRILTTSLLQTPHGQSLLPCRTRNCATNHNFGFIYIHLHTYSPHSILPSVKFLSAHLHFLLSQSNNPCQAILVYRVQTGNMKAVSLPTLSNAPSYKLLHEHIHKTLSPQMTCRKFY